MKLTIKELRHMIRENMGFRCPTCGGPTENFGLSQAYECDSCIHRVPTPAPQRQGQNMWWQTPRDYTNYGRVPIDVMVKDILDVDPGDQALSDMLDYLKADLKATGAGKLLRKPLLDALWWYKKCQDEDDQVSLPLMLDKVRQTYRDVTGQTLDI